MTDYLEIDRLAKDFAARDGQPGLAYGVVAGGALVHSGGLGERWLGGPAPDADTVFRIASMTKSFTASTILLLRDAGALRLDDLAEDYVPELRDLALPSADSPRPTLRHLLTMTGGFPTDDPWGDRQQGLPAADFAALLRRRHAAGLGAGHPVRVLQHSATRSSARSSRRSPASRYAEAVRGPDPARRSA